MVCFANHLTSLDTILAECSTLLASGSDPTNVWQKKMEELSKNLIIAVCSSKATTRKAVYITCEAQAYCANLPAVYSTDDRSDIFAHARDTVYVKLAVTACQMGKYKSCQLDD